MSRPAPFQLRGVEAWQGLVRTVEQAFAESSWPEAGRDVTLAFEPDAARTLRVRVRFTRHKAAQANEDFCVLFLEDVRNMQARSRQEKLAAMGRVSAGIAHEIRNPLAAIAQANALLAEDATDAAQRQLTRMVADNVDRLKRIVDDVMEVAPGAVRHRRRSTRPRWSQRSAATGRARWGEAGRAERAARRAAAAAAGRGLRRRAPAPRARQPARQRAPPRQRRARRRWCCRSIRATMRAAS